MMVRHIYLLLFVHFVSSCPSMHRLMLLNPSPHHSARLPALADEACQYFGCVNVGFSKSDRVSAVKEKTMMVMILLTNVPVSVGLSSVRLAAVPTKEINNYRANVMS